MKKRLLIPGMFLTIALLSGCSAKDTSDAEENTQPVKVEEAETPAPGEENWGTAPEYSVPMITTSPIRYLSITVGQTEEEVNLTWFSPEDTAGQVYWTTAEDTGFEQAALYSASVTPSETIEGYYINRATVTDLSSGADYLYQVGSETAMSPAYSYSAPDFSDSFRFTAVGDVQLGKPVDELDKQKTTWRKVLNKIKYHFPDTSFLLTLGDQVNDYADAEQYNALLNQGVLYSLSLAPVKGNHDMGGAQYSEHFTLPAQSILGTCDDDGDGDYWFVRGSALIMVLDTLDVDKLEEHKDFIASAVEANPDCTWRIVSSHYSPYNAYEEYQENAKNIRPYFLEFAEEYDIDLVLGGHDHAYTRTSFIKGDGSYTEYDSPAVNPDGTMYLILSSSSGSLYHKPSPQDEAVISEKKDAPEVTDVQITPNSLTITTYDAETWEVTDTYEIQKQ
jgi:hypothetical protein